MMLRVLARTLRATTRAAACLAVLLLASVGQLRAQHPGVIDGVVVDAATGAGLDGVAITLARLQRRVTTDAAGRFTLRGIEPGDWTLRMERLGYAEQELAVSVRNGEVSRLTLQLTPVPVAVAGITVQSARGEVDEIRLDRAALDASAAQTAGDALRAVPGVVVRSTGPGAPQLVSLRGMAPDAVLVLVDGVPLNDAVTGEADLSTVDAGAIESITVQPGARSARWGPRAAAGVIRIETRRGGSRDRGLAFGVGSLGERNLAVHWGGGESPSWAAGASLRRQDGVFGFALPDEIGGGTGQRDNGDLRALAAHAAIGVAAAGGELDARLGYDGLERGLPGRGFAPSRHARQDSDRLQGSLRWRFAGTRASVSAVLAAARRRVASEDPAPPFGLPYADTIRSDLLEARAEGTRQLSADITIGGGAEARSQWITATTLAEDAPDAQLDAGVFAHAEIPVARLPRANLVISAQARLDRDPDGGAVPSHSLTLGWSPGNVALYLAHRSSFTPPTPGDRFFRDAVGIEPNPDLAAERVPSEIEAGARLAAALGAWPLTLRASAYRGDIRGMILWAPDYRFVWSPYNQDAKRTGAELTAELTSPQQRLRLSANWTAARTTYDRGRGDNDVQVAYRPRYTGNINGALGIGRTRLDARVRYTGRRTTSPSSVNTLPGFWTVDTGVSYERPVAGWSARFELRVDRVFDEDGALIFGFPEPGRTARFGVRISPGSSQIPSIGVQQ